MESLKIGLIVVFSALILTISIVLLCVLPPEGKIVDYRLEHSTGSEIGYYPCIRVVVENGIDYYMYFPDKTMDEGIQIVHDLKKTISK